MTTIACVIAAAVVAVDTGWQPVEGGGYEYIIQIEPSLVDVLVQGEAVTSEVPAALQSVRRYRVVVGSGKLPRIDPPVAKSPAASQPPLPGPPAAEPPAGQPLPLGPPPTEPVAEPAPLEPAPTNPAAAQPPASAAPAAEGPTASAPPPTPSELKEDSALTPPAGVAEPIAAEPPPIRFPDAAQPEQLAAHETAQPAAEESSGPGAAAGPPARPWGALLLVAVGLFASLSGNVYLGWITWGTRKRYRALVRRSRGVDVTEGAS